MKNLFESLKIGSIIGKYITGRESKTELQQMNTWLNEDSKHQKLVDELKQKQNIANAVDEFDSIDKDLAWKKYLDRIAALSMKRVLFKWKIAATLLLLFAIAGILSNYWNPKSKNSEFKQLYTTVLTKKGQTSKIVLPDSSIVWLNSSTALTYSNNFSIKNRDIILEGEAYFKVRRNEKIPLIVNCNDFKINVLGTEFNVNAYPKNSKISVVLDKGSIKLTHNEDKFLNLLLKPGEKAQYDNDQNQLLVSTVESYKYTSWKDGILIFKDDPMMEVLEKLEHWYGIDIEVRNNEVYDLIFNATIRDENMEDIFELMKFSCSINYTINYSHTPEIPTKIIITN